jgi:rod shape-determining protein MreC
VARRRSNVRRAGAGRRFTPGVIAAVLLAIGAVAAIVLNAGRGPGGGVVAAGDDGAAAAGRAATGPARAGENLLQRLGGMWGASARVEELERENRELQTWRELAERLGERNARYEALLRMPASSFGEGADIERAIAAQLVLDSGGPFTRTLVANAGADHGVGIGFIALNENGLVGRVVSVGRRSSRVLMLDDYTSRIPVMGEASRVRAVLAGQAANPPELLTQPYQVQAPRLDYIVGAQSLREGERVITSGEGGLFPRGILVGIAQSRGNGEWRVALSAAQRPIDFVRLLPFVDVVAPESDGLQSQGPPLAATSSVAVVGRQTMAPAATAPSPRPRREPGAGVSAEPELPPQPQAAPPPAVPPSGPPQ